MSPIDTLPPLKEVISTYELAPKKALGQNFLLDLNLTSKIAGLVGDLENCSVVEVGPGPGSLTRGLLAKGAKKILAIEKDPRCIAALNEIAEHYPNRLEIINEDALKIDVTKHLSGPIKIAANLPYNVGTELLIRWLTPQAWPAYWSSLTLMFQKEVAERITAKPGSKAYGRLSLLSQWRCDAHIVMELPPQAFTPPPKVHSAIVHLTAKDTPKYPADANVLQTVIGTAFQQRRKMLRSSLKSISPDIETLLIKSDIKPTQRPEEIDLERFCALSRHVKEDQQERSAP